MASKEDVSHYCSLEYIDELREAFRIFDKDNDGAFSASDLAVVMQSFGLTPSEADLMEMITEVDVDGNGVIEFSEFLSMMTSKLKDVDGIEIEVREAFRVFDTDEDGYITTGEMRRIMLTIGDRMKDEEAEILVKDMDINQDGRINIEDLIKLIKNAEEPLPSHGAEGGAVFNK